MIRILTSQSQGEASSVSWETKIPRDGVPRPWCVRVSLINFEYLVPPGRASLSRTALHAAILAQYQLACFESRAGSSSIHWKARCGHGGVCFPRQPWQPGRRRPESH